MFNYFSNNNEWISYPKREYDNIDFIQRRYTDEINRITNYYNNRERAVNNSNMLARLLDLLTPDIDLPLVECLKQIGMTAKHISKQFNIVSTINIGKVMDNILYKENSKEVFLYVSNDIDIFDLEVNWRDAKPIRPIYTTKTDLDYTFPIRQILPEETLSIFEIDVVLLTLQYVMWCKDRNYVDKGTDSTVFIAMYVLPSTIMQYMNLTVFNRFVLLSKGVKLNQSFRHKHPFHVINYTAHIDNILIKIIKDFKNTAVHLHQLINNIPTLDNSNMSDVLKLSNTIYNTQSEWVVWIARIDMVYDLLVFLDKRGKTNNLQYINKLSVVIKYIERRGSKNESVLPESLLEKFNEKIDDIKKLVGKR